MRTLFRIEALNIAPGKKLAVVGSNGCGKSTLLSMLSGKSQPTEGMVALRKGAQVVTVEQNPVYDAEQTVTQVVYERSVSPQAKAARRFRAASKPGVDVDELQAAMAEMDASDAWAWEEGAQRTMEEVGLKALMDRKMGGLSGGEQRRVALACALVDVQGVDLLILDEPTNHLSAEGCDWLQGVLRQLSRTSVLLVTHDRYFLDQVCDEILEIEGGGNTFLHPGSWEDFLVRRAERFQERSDRVLDARIQLYRAQEWMNRGARGRGTKDKSKVAKYYNLQEKAKALIGNEDDGAPDFVKYFAGSSRIRGSKTDGLVALRKLSVSRSDGTKILDEVSLDFLPGMKIGIIGPNGAGKSTLLRAIAKEFDFPKDFDAPKDNGEVFIGDGVKLGFLSQETPVWSDPQQRVMGFIADIASELLAMGEDSPFPQTKTMSPEGTAAFLLKSVNFAEERWRTQLDMLSGGEARRIQLLRVLAQCPNVLMLDEPTNDLDAVTVDALERLLQPWQGTVIVVSHDRALLDGVCDTIVAFPKDGSGKPALFKGGYSDFMENARSEVDVATEAEAATARSVAPAARVEGAPKRLTDKERKRMGRYMEKIEADIERVDTELEALKGQMEEAGSDQEKVLELYDQIGQLEQKQATLYEKWEELGEALQR